jgi:serine O-acetyltransferase
MIGDDCKVGAGSVVVNDVPARSTVVGNPAQIVRRDGQKVPDEDLDTASLPDPLARCLEDLDARLVVLEKKRPGAPL